MAKSLFDQEHHHHIDRHHAETRFICYCHILYNGIQHIATSHINP